MNKAILIAIAASTMISASAMAETVVCPSASEVNAGLSQSAQGVFTYQVGPWAQVGQGSTVQPAADAVVSQQSAMVFPTAMLYRNSMTCAYTSTTSPQGVTLAIHTPVKADLSAAGNQWKTPANNGVYFCNSSISTQCPAVTK